jgi:hypothetical protein
MSEQSKLAPAWDNDPIASMLQQIHFQYTTKRLRSLTVASDNRLDGKTTVSTLLARGLVEIYGFKVLYVDLNPQGDALLSKHLKSYQSNEGIVQSDLFSFSIFRIKDLEIDWSKNIFDGPYLNRLITSFTEKYDIVLVDAYVPSNENEPILKINTDTNLIVKSSKSKTHRVEDEIVRDLKKTLGIVFNE